MNYRANIPKLYLSNFLSGMVFWFGIEKYFLSSIGVDTFGLAVLSALFIATILIFDVPSGVLADRWSRKKCLILAIAMQIVSAPILGSSHSLLTYLLGAIPFGLYVVLTSGTFQALVYDTLHETGQAKDYARFWGRIYSCFMIGIFVSSLVSGFMAEHIGVSSPYYLSIIPGLLNIALLVTLKEPNFHKLTTEGAWFKHARTAGMALLSTSLLRNLWLLLFVMLFVTNFADEYNQYYFIALGFGAIGVGILNASHALSAALGRFNAHYFNRLWLWFVPLQTLAFLSFTIWHSRWGLLCFMLGAVLRNIIENETEARVQDQIDSSIRATALSVISFSANLITIPATLLFGWVARRYDIFYAYQMVSAVLLAYLAYWLWIGRKQIPYATTSATAPVIIKEVPGRS